MHYLLYVYVYICTCTYMYMHIHACMYTCIYIHTYACIWMFLFMLACITIPSVWKGGPTCENKASRGHGRICTARSRLHACSCNFSVVCGESVYKFTARVVDHMHSRRVLHGHYTRTHTYIHILHGHAGTTASLRIHTESVLAQAAVRCVLLPVHLLGLCVFVCLCVPLCVFCCACACACAFLCISVCASVFVCVSLFEADTVINLWRRGWKRGTCTAHNMRHMIRNGSLPRPPRSHTATLADIFLEEGSQWRRGKNLGGIFPALEKILDPASKCANSSAWRLHFSPLCCSADLVHLIISAFILWLFPSAADLV